MPQIYQEGDLIFEFPDGLSVRKFDDAGHGEQRLKAVDFIIESDDKVMFIEVKDPEHSRVPPQHQDAQLKSFILKVAGEKHFKEEIAPKLKDSIFYLHLQRQLPDKTLQYVYVTGLSTLDAAQFSIADKLMRKACCFPGPGPGWQRDYAVVFLDLRQWQRKFPHIPVRRVGAA
jgi:hypothetical protein